MGEEKNILQLVLRSVESKKLIAEAVYNMASVQKALREGVVVIHPSSTTYFLHEMITGRAPDDGWAFGVVTRDGLCRSKAAVQQLSGETKARKLWVFKNGVEANLGSLDDVLSQMGVGDIFIKGANALDQEGRPAVLTSTPGKGGTSGKVMKYKSEKGFEVIIPVSSEKCIPSKLSKVTEYLEGEKATEFGGLACGVFPIDGTVVNETAALASLFGVESVVGAAGGIEGAEGGVVIYCRCSDEAKDRIISFANNLKDARLPSLEYVTYD